MNYESLLEYLEIDSPDEFVYFETMADLIESEEFIEMESMYQLFERVDLAETAGIISDYFLEITSGLPDDSNEMYSLLDQIRLCLSGLAANSEDESDIRRFTDEFFRFRQWYVYESEVELISESTGKSEIQCVRDAVTTARIEKLGGEEYRYNYGNALNYRLDSYTMSVADLVAAGDSDEE